MMRLLALLLCLTAFASTAQAQTRAWPQDFGAYGSAAAKPQPTEPSYITMLFYKLARLRPDFNTWARESDVYKSAPVHNRPIVLDQRIQELQNIYSLLTPQEPIVIETPVKLSAYSAANKGFFVESFKDDTFFPITDQTRTYAIVPQGIMDRQWMKVTDERVAKAIEAASADEKNPATMVLMLYPRFADGSAPAVIDGKPYWLLSAEIQKMTLYAPGSSTALWQSDVIDDSGNANRNLLRLRQ